MSKKIPLGIALAMSFIAIAVTVAVTITVYMNVYNKLIQDLPQRAQLYSKLSDMDELVRTNYYGTIDSDELDMKIARGYIDGLDDDYSFYLSAEDYTEYYSNSIGDISGIGIQTLFDEESEKLIVAEVAQDSPAQQAGIEKGDIILSVQSEQITAENHASLSALFDGEKLTGVDLELMRDAEGTTNDKTFAVNVAKGYKAQSCFYSLDGTVGYIKLTEFYENTADAFAQAISALSEKGVTGIIIDVRNNTSNNFEYAAKVIDVIVPLATEGTGELATAKNAAGETIEIFSADSSSVNLPLAVLINDRTEGAAELLACDLMDFGKARLFGETTVGHGTLQKIFRLDDGGAVVLTVAKIYPYISDCYDGIGVIPHESVYMTEKDKNRLATLDKSEDEQYKAALNYLSQ